MLPGLATMTHSADASSGLVEINDATAYKYTTGAGAVASYSIGTDGYVRINGVPFGTWLKSGLAAAYDVHATVVSGSVSSGTTGSWLPLTSTQTWSRNRATVGLNSVTLFIEIALTGTTVALDSATVTIEAERDVDTGTL